MKITTKSLDISGRTLSLEVGRLAEQSTSSVLARYGDTTVLAVVTVGNEDHKKDYFPLSVDYQERLYAGGRIKGSRWVKREGRATDAETLSGRLIDRSIRPLFPKSFRREVQVVVMVLSVDADNDPDILGSIAVSAALSISPIPWNGPISSVRLGEKDGQIEVNPLNGNRTDATLDLVVSSSEHLITMIEAGARQLPEDLILSGLKSGLSQNKEIIALINDLVKTAGQPKWEVKDSEIPETLVKKIKSAAKSEIADLIPSAALHEGNIMGDLIAKLSDGLEEADKSFVPKILEELMHETIRDNILKNSLRPDSRKLDEIRPLDVSVGVLPRVHGSAIFARGQTQALSVTTLGAPSLSQSLESAEGEATKRYIHHYNFPPFSTGETGRLGSPGRREIGHGALAERALLPVIPDEENFPYAIRVVSEIMSSNGSTSMASTCGSTMSLMDAGVPLLAPVAGISTGLITSESYPKKSDDYVLLTDIIGMEDHHGDMDFKVAGTKDGITAIQLDVKVPGITLDICEATFARAKTARMQILDVMKKTLALPRPSISQYAPQISTTSIPVDKIGELIGPGGKNIKQLMADTNTTIDVRDDGSVFVSGTDADGVSRAITWITGLGKEAVPGEIYEGTVARIQPFGAFVNILPGKDGLVHVSQMAADFVEDPRTIVTEGQKVKVWVTEIDAQGRINLSMLFDENGQPGVKVRSESDSPRPFHRDPFQSPRRMGRGDRPPPRRRF
ncbi:polyribonucleotide nucleotidyltransferase [Candidatus Amesbacteria bacterium RIFOXYB1_FULL_44_23]|uniref:Polyribonucleotide nucleotidyltransferase n=1 Tax=Candidatus Amesbacteria bacterium RIFOXYB1_FULL_44_23 TaxID=1797263 RepID=A0A1F4ZRL4_9BACT|nr:MAG: polyribonucleotide nucleotidyltransferase [Candidatus Amesbacteria bacterium RIFOXYB1_FULL_44_23]